jgi:predicted esterase
MKRRIILLHGYGQNAAVFRRQTSALRKDIEKIGLECTYVDGTISLDDKGESRSWWRADSQTFEYQGAPESLARIKSLVIESPVETVGILGFSQGAVLTSLLCDIWQNNIKVSIMVSGFVSRDPRHREMYSADTVKLPTMHVIGQTDELVPPDLSRDQSKNFQTPQILEHAGGHYLPQTGATRKSMIEFISSNCSLVEASSL